jgi:AraC family transcriptional activator of mtrCDE
VLLERLFENLSLKVEPFASCHVASGWRLQLPLRDWIILHFVLKGEGGLLAGKEPTRHDLTPNTLAIMPPSLTHALECGIGATRVASVRGDEPGPICRFGAGPAGGDDLVVACGRIQATYGGGPGLFDLMRAPLVVDFSDAPPMRTVFESLMDEKGELGSAAMMNALMNQCLISVFRRISADPDCPLPWLAALGDPGLGRVLGEILDHPEKPHSLETLAELAAMSRSVFAEKFHASFHRTPMNYVRDVRLRRAAQLLLREGASVEEIATKVGFSSRSHFSRIFAEQLGRSPVEYRRQVH